MMFRILLLTVLVKYMFADKTTICNNAESLREEYLLLNYLPKGFGQKNVKVMKKLKFLNVDECVSECCSSENCDSIIITKITCYFMQCTNKNDCYPVKGTNKSHNYYISFENLHKFDSKHAKEPKRNEVSETCENDENCPKEEFCNQLKDTHQPRICTCKSGFSRKGKICIKEKEEIKTKAVGFKNKTVGDSSKSTKVEISSLPVTSTVSSKTRAKVNIKSKTNYSLSADAGLDITMKVPKSSLIDKPEVISIYGSGKIMDKGKIVKNKSLMYFWKRLPESLAAGTIVNSSDHDPILRLTHLLQGQYFFEFTVSSEDGMMAKDTMKLNIIETDSEIERNFLKIVFSANVYRFSEKDKINFSQRMAHIIEKDLSYQKCLVEVHSVIPDRDENTIITFYVKMFNNTLTDFKIISSDLLENKLRRKILDHKFIFDYPVTMFQSQICYNDCGGHGVCDNVTHRCVCSLPWLNNILHERNTGQSNCDMHVMIVVVSCSIGFFIFVMLIICLKKVIKIIRSRTSYRKKILKYRLLENSES